ncbi:MAG: periplasmic binding protein/LacI transcriptional regulator [Solirubrobacterales bacterium]|nr:periplasmic binding protein/LacI transcriptional regulator [Solirubrobacterales bacterium]
MTSLPFTRRVRGTVAVALVLAASAVLAAGCGSSDSSSSASAPASTPASTGTTTTAAAPAAVPFAGAESTLPTSYPTPTAGTLTLGYLNPSSGQESLNAMQHGFEREAAKYGAKVTALDAKLSVDQQVSQFQTLIDQKVDAIAVYPLDPGALAPLVKRANAAGIPVVGDEVTLDSTQPATGFATQVWLGPDENAYEIAKGMAAAKPGAKVGLIGFAAPVPYIKTIVTRVGFWAKKFGLTVVGESDNKDDSIAGGTTAATGLLGRYSDLDAIFAYNEDSALGAYSAIRSAGKQKDIAIFSNNGATEGLQGVKNGKLTATWQFDSLATGALTADAALNAASTVKIPPAVLVPKPKEINPSNVGSAKNWDQQLADAG